MADHIVPAKNFVITLAANVDNEKLDDASFREFVRSSLDIVEGIKEWKKERAKDEAVKGHGIASRHFLG